MVPADGSGSGARTDDAGAEVMATTFKTGAPGAEGPAEDLRDVL
jgi:hypothetical protein